MAREDITALISLLPPTLGTNSQLVLPVPLPNMVLGRDGWPLTKWQNTVTHFSKH